MKLLERCCAVVCDFVRPIPDASLPRIAEQVTSAATTSLVVILLAAPGSPGFLSVAVLVGAADPLRALVAAPLVATLFILNNVWSRTEHGRRHPNGILLLTAIGVALGSALLGWTSGAAAEGIIHLMVILPALIAMFVPWRPVYALLGAALALASFTAGLSFIQGELVWPSAMMGFTALCVGVASAVAQQLNRRFMLRFETAQERLLAADRLSNLGRMTAGIAHELKTPMAAIQNSLESARSLLAELGDSIGHEAVTADDLREIARELGAAIDTVGSSADRATAFVQEIRHQGAGGISGRRAPFAVADRVAAVIGLLSFRLRKSPVMVEVDDIDQTSVLFGDPGKFDQVLTNLLSNALDACEEDGHGRSIQVSSRVVDGRVVIAVQDDGPGVPLAIAPRIFESLFTTRTEGTGLGLAISRDLVRGEFGGHLRFVPTAQGARFEIRCPAAAR